MVAIFFASVVRDDIIYCYAAACNSQDSCVGNNVRQTARALARKARHAGNSTGNGYQFRYLNRAEKVLHKVLYKYHPKRPKTPFYAPESTIVSNNMRKAEAFRNRQVSGSIPVVGSIFSIT
jgi:hypothetical protein